MTDYRDGRWYPWFDGDCPVEMGDDVAVLLKDGHYEEGKAKLFQWDCDGDDGDIVTFRVTRSDERKRLIERAAQAINQEVVPSPLSECRVYAAAMYDAGYLKEPNND